MFAHDIFTPILETFKHEKRPVKSRHAFAAQSENFLLINFIVKSSVKYLGFCLKMHNSSLHMPSHLCREYGIDGYLSSLLCSLRCVLLWPLSQPRCHSLFLVFFLLLVLVVNKRAEHEQGYLAKFAQFWSSSCRHRVEHTIETEERNSQPNFSSLCSILCN